MSAFRLLKGFRHLVHPYRPGNPEVGILIFADGYSSIMQVRSSPVQTNKRRNLVSTSGSVMSPGQIYLRLVEIAYRDGQCLGMRSKQHRAVEAIDHGSRN
jgi:hypothetical protein